MSTFQTIASGDLKDAVVSTDGKIAYVSNGEGYVSAFNIATGAFIERWKVGITLGGMDMSQDGRYLVATERSVTSPVGNSTTITIKVHVLDVTTGQVRDFSTEGSSYSGGFFDAVFMSDGKILLSNSNLVLDLGTGMFTTTPGGPYMNGALSASADGSKIIAAPQEYLGPADLPLQSRRRPGRHPPGLQGRCQRVQSWRPGDLA